MKRYIPITVGGRRLHLPVWSYPELRRMAFAQILNARKCEPVIASNTGNWSYSDLPRGTYFGD